jgi:cyclopropane fatty-acyl-phospholipid synthase-like methyltransferase
LKRKIVNFSWEDEDAQKVFADWVPFPDDCASAKDVDAIETFVGLEPPKRILDIGCGNGRHALEFAKRGYKVIGIDIAKQFLNEAKKAAGNVVAQVEFRLQRAMRYEEVIDYLVSAGFSEVTGYKDFNGEPATSEEFYIFLCRKT